MTLTKLWRLLAVATAAAFLSLLAASPAAAADNWMYTDDSNPGGKVEFTQLGDIVKLCDIEADDHSTILYVWDQTTHKKAYVITAAGNGNCTTRNVNNGGVYDLIEDHQYSFEICLNRGSVYTYCDTAIWNNW
jgi:hypothetical protein